MDGQVIADLDPEVARAVSGLLRAARRMWQDDIAAALAERRSSDAQREPLLVKKPEAARRLGVSPRTIERLLRTGELRAVKVGRAVRLVTAEVDAFAAALAAPDRSSTATGRTTAHETLGHSMGGLQQRW